MEATAKELEMMIELKAFAEANYAKGYDTFVECYEDSEWLELIRDEGGNIKKVKAMMKTLASIWKERESY